MPNENRSMPTPEANSTNHPHGRGLHVERFGGNVAVLDHPDADDPERGFFSLVPSLPADGAVLASAAAIRHAGFLDALRQACRQALPPALPPAPPPTTPHPPRRLWVAVAGLTEPGPHGRSVAEELAAELDTDVLVPGGRLALIPGGSLYTAGGRWQLFRSGQSPRSHVVRYPTPRWEQLLPPDPVIESGLIAEPIPAGLRIREAEQTPPSLDELDLTVPQSRHHPRLVLGSPGEAALPVDRLAPLLARLSGMLRTRWELVPSTTAEGAPERVRDLAGRLGNDVLATTGRVLHDGSGDEQVVVDDDGGEAWSPFPVSLWHPAGGTARVALTAPAPRGWVRLSPLVYRPTAAGPAEPAPEELVARVVPGGLALLPLAQATTGGAADGIAFEQHRMTVSVGLPYLPVPPEAPGVLRQLLDGLTPGQRARVRLLILGIADERMRAELTTIAGEPNGRAPAYPPISPADDVADSTGTPLDEAHSPGTTEDEPVAPPPSAERGEPTDEMDSQQRPAVQATPLPTHRPRTVSEPPAELLSEPARRPSTPAPAEPATPAPHGEAPEDPAAAPPEPVPDREPISPAPAEPARPRLVAAQASEAGTPHHHRSTSEERSRFARALGSDFDEALPGVNTVLATHPALREHEGEEAKADFVAVILYTGRGQHGGNAVNRLLRTGHTGSARDYVACLTSGLRRLPVHRGPSFRFGGSPEEEVDGCEPGAVLSEPGFLSATAADDLSTHEEHGDVVIWSHSARRVSLFGRNSLPEEVVFPSGSRFKVLSTADEGSARPAVLLRELRPDERTSHDELDETDLAVLPKLRRALNRRHDAEPRVLTEQDQLDRMSSPVGLVPAELRDGTEAHPPAGAPEPARPDDAAGLATTAR
ncbi:hypothetical protein SAMN04489718_0627 [Actinopolyspora saharensis]|uniref:NAD(+)--protein-arginine ADP-ribosyltransferase n=2 Tax=Actinopolyspora saharensis TaxID=995062 RepID=A0A1H0YRE1_9ACTN|nr:hypothetical protein SAMN04489718_0627 [Actinopolyspora saharensis]